MSWQVYIVRCADDSLYTGICKDLDRRLQQHNQAGGQGAKYTRGRAPVELIYHEQQPDRGAATVRELEIKKMNRKQKLQLAGVS